MQWPSPSEPPEMYCTFPSPVSPSIPSASQAWSTCLEVSWLSWNSRVCSPGAQCKLNFQSLEQHVNAHFHMRGGCFDTLCSATCCLIFSAAAQVSWNLCLGHRSFCGSFAPIWPDESSASMYQSATQNRKIFMHNYKLRSVMSELYCSLVTIGTIFSYKLTGKSVIDLSPSFTQSCTSLALSPLFIISLYLCVF